MADFITLLGAEDVRNAANRMSEAAERMNQAVSYLDSTLHQQRLFMDEWLARFEQALNRVDGSGAARG